MTVMARVVALVVFALAASARAQPAPPPPPAPPGLTPPPNRTGVRPTTRPQTRWYGWQIMLSDAASIGFGLATGSSELFATGYFLGPIVVHTAHDNPDKAVGSPLLRAGLPLAGGLIGAAADDCSDDSDTLCFGGLVVGLGLGGLAALIVDWRWAHETLELPPGQVAIGSCYGGADCTTYGFRVLW